MKRFIQGESRRQITLPPECPDDCIGEDNPVRVTGLFADELDLAERGFDSAGPASTGRPGCHPWPLRKIYIHGYPNRIQSGRRLERGAQRNVELMRLTGRPAPDFKTIADFCHHNGQGIRIACKRFIFMSICRGSWPNSRARCRTARQSGNGRNSNPVNNCPRPIRFYN